MSDRYMTIIRVDNTASRLTVTPTQIRLTLAKGDRNEQAIMKAAPIIAEKITGDRVKRGTFRNAPDGISIHMTTRTAKNGIPGQKFRFKNGVLV